MKTDKELEVHMKSVLENASIIDHVLMDQVLDDVNAETIKNILESPKKLEIVDGELHYIDENGDKHSCPSYGLSISADGKWLSSKLPNIPFDIEQNGNLRKAEEAQSAYCCACVISVLDDESFKTELNNVIASYDFSSMMPKEGTMSFSELLNDFLNLQSMQVNVIVSAAKYRITDLKKDSEIFLQSGIEERRIEELRNLTVLVKDINRKYSTGKLSPTAVQSLKKIEILALIDKRNDEINSFIEKSSEKTLYKIFQLSSEYLSPITKRRIQKLVDSEISKLAASEDSFVTQFGEVNNIVSKWRRKYIKLAVLSYRREQVDKFLANEDEYNLPVKQ